MDRWDPVRDPGPGSWLRGGVEIWWDIWKKKVWSERGAEVGRFDPEGLWTL